MARKAWADLTPAYRARLERAGVTAQGHSRGVSITRAVGHDWGLPSMRERRQRADARVAARAAGLGQVPAGTVAETIARYGPERAGVLVDWQERRTELGKGLGAGLTLEAYITDRYGPDAWSDGWEEIYDDLDVTWDYYHD